VQFDGRRVLYSWIGATRRDWRGQGHFRALTEQSEEWAIASGFNEIVVKTKNRYYDMRAVLAQLKFDVVKHEPVPEAQAESKVYLAKLLPAELVRGHRSVRTVVSPTDEGLGPSCGLVGLAAPLLVGSVPHGTSWDSRPHGRSWDPTNAVSPYVRDLRVLRVCPCP
jgi:hypothetical protein